MKGELIWSKSKIAEYISNDSELAEIAPPEINFTGERWWGSSEKDFLDYVEKEVEIINFLWFFMLDAFNFPSKYHKTVRGEILDWLLEKYGII